MQIEIKELDIGGVLDHAIQLFRRTFMPSMVTVLAVSGPFYVLNTLLDRAGAQRLLQDNTVDSLNVMLFLFYTVFLVPLQYSIITSIMAGEYLGAPISRQTAFRLARRGYVSLVWARVVRYVAVALGALALVLPGLWLYVRYYFVEEVMILEGATSGASLKRSGQLSRHAFGMIVILSLCFTAGTAALFFRLELLEDSLLRICLEVALSVLLAPMELALNCVLYFSARCSQDQFDVQLATMRTDRIVDKPAV